MIGVSLRSPRLGYYGSPTSVRDVGEEHHHDGDVLHKVTSSTLNDELKARAVSFSTSWIQSARGWSNTNNHTNRP
jgi:hypothetical protein